MKAQTMLDLGKKIRSIAEIGLLYTTDNFDKARYRELKSISETIISDELGTTPKALNAIYKDLADYPTPKVDIRALVLDADKKILMVQEKADHRWSLPGGWGEVGHTPSEVAVKEVFEETGLDVVCKYLCAVFDKRMHDHPPQPFYVYKMIFYCELISPAYTPLKPAFDVLDAKWFSFNSLPPLSEDRILYSQINLVYQHVEKGNYLTIFD